MTPTKAMLDILQLLLANDAASLADPAAAVHVHLAMANFNPASVLIPADITEATFVGSAVLSAGLGAQQAFTIPATGERIVQLKEPAGGWHWVATAATDLPQSIYGWYVTNLADTILYGSELFSAPIAILSIGNGIDVGQVRFRMPAGALA